MSKQIIGDIASRLGKLALKEKHQIEKQSGKLQQEINRAGFRIFECLSDLGYFTWNAPLDAPYHNLASIINTDQLKMSSYLDVNGMPHELGDLTTMQTPKLFLSLPPKIHKNQFPHGNLEIVCFHVAARYRGITFDDVDFAFGGSTLEMLAKRNDGKKTYMVTRVPGTKTIMVSKSKSFNSNLTDVGYQFERLMTGRPMGDTSSNMYASVEHLHLMNVGGYRVFFHGETDAIRDGSPVEIKFSKRRSWGTKLMFQMISSGSTMLCSGTIGSDQLLEVAVPSLQQVATVSLEYLTKREIEERNILECMERMRSQMEGATPGDVFEVSFDADRSLNLLPVHHSRSADLLPPADIIFSLISPTKE